MEHTLTVNGKVQATFETLENALVVAEDIFMDLDLLIDDVNVNNKRFDEYEESYDYDFLSKANFKLFGEK